MEPGKRVGISRAKLYQPRSHYTNEDNIKEFVIKANHYHDTIKFAAEIADSEIAFLDTKVYKGERFNRDSTLDVQTQYKQTETSQYTNFYSCDPPGVKES